MQLVDHRHRALRGSPASLDTCLPIKVSDVSIWRRPSPLIETAVEGVMLTAQSDMVKVYPQIWPNN